MTGTADGQDLNTAMVNGSASYSDMHTALIRAKIGKQFKPVAALVFRTHGDDLVEWPTVATAETYEGQGFNGLLLKFLMAKFSELEIKRIVLPSCSDASSYWKHQGFVNVDKEVLRLCDATGVFYTKSTQLMQRPL